MSPPWLDSSPPETGSLPDLAATAPGYGEVFDAFNQPRAHWRRFLDFLYAGGPDLPGRLEEDANRLLRESGATYNVRGAPGTRRRAWPLDPIPLILDAGSWNTLAVGLIQRHRLLTLLLRDLYGPGLAIRDGIVPGEAIFGWRGFLLAAHGLDPRGAIPLSLYAADLGRDPTGRFLVLSDRTQAPSGHGYVLQNRRVMGRLYSGQLATIPPLLPFFRTMRSDLVSLTPFSKQDAHVVLLTPGPANETHYEHALLAHFMGLTLAQGDDLTVRSGRLWLKTLGGLMPVEVVLRRVDEAWCDPLELREDSLLGVVGLAHASRSGQVTLANALGSGVLETLALHAYMPALARYFLGEDLLLDNPRTWWLGDPVQRAAALERWDSLTILPLTHDPSFPISGAGAQLPASRERVMEAPHRFVAREPFVPSVAPGVDRGRLCQRPVLLRAYLTNDGSRSQVMPGGLARVAAGPDTQAFSPLQGGVTKDVWVIHPTTVVPSGTLMGTPVLDPAPLVGVPSRVAENLFWIGRYAERAEGTIRLFREFMALESEETGLTHRQRHLCQRLLLVSLTHVTATYPGFAGDEGRHALAEPFTELRSTLLDPERIGSLAFSLRAMIQCAFSVRDRLSTDTWELVDGLSQALDRLQGQIPKHLGGMFWETGPLLQGLTALAGLTWENMNRDLGWRFLDLGRRLERAMFLAQLLETTLAEPMDEGGEAAILERLLAINDSLAAYRMQFRTALELPSVLEKLIQDDTDPRSLVFQLKLMEAHAGEIPRGPGLTLYRTPLGRVVFETLAAIRLATPESLARPDTDSGRREELVRLTERIRKLLPLFSERTSNSYFRHAEPPHHLFKSAWNPA
ncbi:MAG: circularly permuted type 2 ATP-grasp protein [Magnetococcales bacterium]|nr:circularly permuted type 2 ATP-grasp protein [Magnetococcales bacterium]